MNLGKIGFSLIMFSWNAFQVSYLGLVFARASFRFLSLKISFLAEITQYS